MIFIWTSDGGPLQYIGLAFILIRFLVSLLQIVEWELPSYETLLRTAVSILGSMLPFALFVGYRSGITVQRIWHAVTNHPLVQAAREQYWRTAFGMGMVMIGVVLATANPAMLLQSLQFLPLLLFLYSKIRGDNEGGAGGPFPAGWSTAPPANDLSNIVKIVSRMPVEDYVAEGELDHCTISELKQMLHIRQRIPNSTNYPTSEVSRPRPPNPRDFIEKCELVEAVRSCRQASESCCICYEDYQKGDTLRVLPYCRHEFHLECIDQWAYTFATSRDRQSRQPSCPLCNAALR
jgi:hypothetical protein